MKKLLQTLKEKWAEYLIEILVIIFSILIAFTLDNWNTQKSRSALFKSQLDQIYIQSGAFRDRLKGYINNEEEEIGLINQLLAAPDDGPNIPVSAGKYHIEIDIKNGQYLFEKLDGSRALKKLICFFMAQSPPQPTATSTRLLNSCSWFLPV